MCFLSKAGLGTDINDCNKGKKFKSMNRYKINDLNVSNSIH